MKNRRHAHSGIAIVLMAAAALAIPPALGGAHEGVSDAVHVSDPGQVVLLDVPTLEQGLAAHRFALDEESGVLWIVRSTLDGPPARYSVLGYDTNTGAAAHYSLPFETTLYSPDSTFVTCDSHGRVWMAVDDVFGFFDVNSALFARVRLPETERIPGVFAQGDLATGADDHALSRWRTQPVTSMSVGDDGSIWLTRDHAAVLFRYEPATGIVDLIDAPPGVDVPGYIRMVGGRATVSEYRAVSRAPRNQPEWWTLSEDRARWESFGLSACIPATDGTRAVVATEDDLAVTGLAESPGTLERLLPQPGGNTPIRAHEVVALGGDGGLWYVKDALDLARLDVESGAEVVYRLPRVTLARTPTGGERTSLTRSPHPSPRFEAAIVDVHGNLWFSYTAGDTKFGVAYR